jgi:hypothetical protein
MIMVITSRNGTEFYITLRDVTARHKVDVIQCFMSGSYLGEFGSNLCHALKVRPYCRLKYEAE